MGKLKAPWAKTDIPTRIKVKLWLAMKDNPTLGSWQKAIANMHFEESDDKYVRTTRDTYKYLQEEIRSMPKGDVDALPPDLRNWVHSVRPDLDSSEVDEHIDTSPVDKQKEHIRKLQGMASTAYDGIPLYFPDFKTTPPETFGEFNVAVTKVYRRLTGDPDWNELAHHLGDEATKIERLSNELDDLFPGAKLDRYYEILYEAWITIRAGGTKTISESSDRRKWDYEGLMPTCPKCPDQNWPISYLGIPD